MKYLFPIFSLFISVSAFASLSKDCKEMKSELIKLALVGSNLANVNTTRTPDGGPYKPYKIKSCSDGGCSVEQSDAGPLLKYQPDHPDANENGYVPYPNIDKETEYSAFNMSAAKLKLLALNKTCGATIIDNGSSALLQYPNEKVGAKEDIFNFDKNSQVISWSRVDSKGVSTAINFLPDGKAFLVETVQNKAVPRKLKEAL